jgi:hypothetical protein
MPTVELSSIFETVKKFCGIDLDSGAFDQDIILLTNGALFNLTQIGIGPRQGFKITGTEEVWTDFLGDVVSLEAAKALVCIRVRILFDPNSISAAVLGAYQTMIAEYEWRLLIQGELNAEQPTVP